MGPYKKGTTVYGSSCRVYRVSAKFNMYTSRWVFKNYPYITIHLIILAFGVFVNTFQLPDDIPCVSTSRRE